MDDLLASAQAEWYKLRRRPLPWILLAVMIGYLLLTDGAFLLLASASAAGPALVAAAAELRQLVRPPNSLYVTLAGVNQIGSLLTIILGAMTIGSELQWGTLRLVLARQPRRALYLNGLLLTLLGGLAAGLAIVVLAGLLLSVGVTLLSGDAIDWSALGQVLMGAGYWLALLRTYATLVVYLLLGLALTMLTRSLGAGLGLALGYFILDSILATSALNLARSQLESLPGIGTLVQWGAAVLLGYNLSLINSLSGAELQLTGAAAGAIEPVVVPITAVVVVLLYALFFACLPYLLLRRRDVTG